MSPGPWELLQISSNKKLYCKACPFLQSTSPRCVPHPAAAGRQQLKTQTVQHASPVAAATGPQQLKNLTVRGAALVAAAIGALKKQAKKSETPKQDEGEARARARAHRPPFPNKTNIP